MTRRSELRRSTPIHLLALLITVITGCGGTRAGDPGRTTTPKTPAELYAAASATCASLPLRTKGTIHYFCDCQAGAQQGCVAGSDANGCTADHPCQTWSKALQAFNAMNGGDTVALCKGGAWSVTSVLTAEGYPAGSNNLTNTRCAVGSGLTDPANGSTCDLRDYAPSWGGTARPLLQASGSAAVIIDRWGGSVNGVRILNLAFRGGNAGPNGGVYLNHTAIASGVYDTMADSDWLICNDTFDRFRLGLHLANGLTATWGNFLVWGNRFTMNDLDAMLLGSGPNNRIDANFFDDNGGMAPHPISHNAAHTVYLAGNHHGDFGSTNTSVVNNEFRRSGAGGAVGRNATGILVGHEMYDGLNVENNIIDAGEGALGTCWAVDFGSAQSAPTYYRRVTIRRNWINGGGVGITLGQAPGAVIENNVITLLGPSEWKQGIISPFDTALSAAFYRTHVFDGQDISVGDDVQNDTVIRNNTIYITGANGATRGITMGREGTGHAMANNAIYAEAGSCFVTPLGHCSVTTSAQCSIDSLGGAAADGTQSEGCPSGETCVGDASAYRFVGNNACFGGAQWGTAYDATTHVVADPLFASPPTDFTIGENSPLIGAGATAYAPGTDFLLVPRPSPPSIGAYER